MNLKSILILCVAMCILSNCSSSNEKVMFYLGTSDATLKNPIKLCELDVENENFFVQDSFVGSIAPSYICFYPDEDYLFAASRPLNGSEGQINSYNFDKGTFQLSLVNTQKSKGVGPAHLSVHPDGKTLFVANYSSGTIASLPIEFGGRLDSANFSFQQEGTGPVENRQEGPHAHYIHADPSGNYVLAVDLGADKVYIYSYNKDSGKITLNENQPYLKMEAGAGPRHLVFHPSGKWFYVINELNSTLSFCSFNSINGESALVKTISTLPVDVDVENYPAAIRMHKSGRFLYGSNRGHNSIVLFSIDDKGAPSFIETTGTEGDWPRDFNIDPSGKYMIVANQRGNNLSAFRINQKDGTLESMNISLTASEPTCVLFFE